MTLDVETQLNPLFLPTNEDEDMALVGTSMSVSSATDDVQKLPIEENSGDLDCPGGVAAKVETADSGVSKIRGKISEEPLVTPSRLSPSTSHVNKRRKVSPANNLATTDQYLGSFLVPNAWSTVKGSGYVKSGDTICVERDTLQSDTQTSKQDTKKKVKGKQVTLTSMMKPQPKNSAIKKPKTANTIVRLSNERGFEFGRLPTNIAPWISKLLDLDIITFKGSTVVECEEKLRSGSDLLVSLSVYMRPSAFKRYEQPTSELDVPKLWFNEGAETEREEMLRQRKTALRQLFEKLDLRPRAGNNVVLDKENDVPNKQQKVNISIEKKPQAAESASRDTKDADEENEEEVLSDNELDLIYRRAQANDVSMNEMDPCDDFALTLRPYQKQALCWMHSRETGAASARQANSMHPLWAEYIFPSKPTGGLIDLTADDISFYYNTHSGELSLEFPRAENLCRGGILADVGMGKTIMVSSLIQTNRASSLDEAVDDPAVQQRHAKPKQLKLDVAFRPTLKSKQSSRRSRATLIVAPASLLDQWCTELQRSSKKGTLNVMIWHGQNREDLETMIDADDSVTDIVITSYGTLAAEHARTERTSKAPAIFDIEWYRVVLDEAHNCKSRTSKTAKAVFDLNAVRRWALTGTPIVNRLEDLYSLLKFLNFAPWSEYSFFRSVVTLPFLNREPKAIEVVQVILESVLLRREKSMRDKDGRKIVELPSKEVVVESLEFNSLERSIYDSLYRVAKIKFDNLAASGMVGKRYTHVLAMLMRLRRAVLHPSLVLDKSEADQVASKADGDDIDVNELIKQFAESEADTPDSNENYAQSVLNSLKDDEDCPICLVVMDEPMLIPGCMHRCCKDCILTYLLKLTGRGEEGHCPTCRQGPVVENELLEVVKTRRSPRQTSVGIEPEDPVAKVEHSSPGFSIRKNDFKSSTKLNALIQNLRRLQDQDPCFRAVVFSQFTSFLDLIEVALQRENLEWYRLDGSTEIKKRHIAIAEFNKPSRKPKIFMLSLKAGGVGLNLTTANHVFMMDCWWNAAIEQQAIDRVHRIGQEKSVYVKHFIISDTIEGRILQIQKRKTAIVKEAFKGQGSSDTESLDNLKIMFGED